MYKYMIYSFMQRTGCIRTWICTNLHMGFPLPLYQCCEAFLFNINQTMNSLGNSQVTCLPSCDFFLLVIVKQYDQRTNRCPFPGNHIGLEYMSNNKETYQEEAILYQGNKEILYGAHCTSSRSCLLMNGVLPPRKGREPNDSDYHIPSLSLTRQEWLSIYLEPLVGAILTSSC